MTHLDYPSHTSLPYYRLFELCPGLTCVLLNGCYSTAQAQEIQQHVPYVIGMNCAIADKAARIFSEAFYGALGA